MVFFQNQKMKGKLDMSNVIDINETLKEEKEKVFGTDFDVAEFSDLYFVSYQWKRVGSHIGKWVRIPHVTERQMKHYVTTMDFQDVEDFKVVPYTEIVKPLDADGLSKEDCDHLGRDFVPAMLKGQLDYGHQYGIDPEFGLDLRDALIEQNGVA